MAFKKPGELGGGSFFSPKDYETALALIVEPKSVRKDVPNTYNGVTKQRDEVSCDITVFRSSEELDGQAQPHVEKDVVVHHTALANAAQKAMGEQMAALVRKLSGKTGTPYYAFVDLDPSVEAKVVAWFEAREAAMAAALADVPDF